MTVVGGTELTTTGAGATLAYASETTWNDAKRAAQRKQHRFGRRLLRWATAAFATLPHPELSRSGWVFRFPPTQEQFPRKH